MARHAIVLVLLVAACVLELASAAAAKGGKNRDHPDFPQPVRRGGPCHIKSPECIDTYTETDAKRLAELGDFSQVAVAPDLPPGLTRELRPREKPKRKRKASCREEGAACRRPQRKRGGAEGEGRKGPHPEGRKRKAQREGSARGKAGKGGSDADAKTHRVHGEQQPRKGRRPHGTHEGNQRRQRPSSTTPPAPPPPPPQQQQYDAAQ